ncbi:MAG: hypothetical protein JXA94_00690 [Parachlamydiales bacterium]|nr:hypothetical protein [Parachlamydiales bacterium]
MNQNERTKLCPSCDGMVAMEISICPYCGSSVFNKNEDFDSQILNPDVKSLSPEETLQSLYPPPYKPKVIDTRPGKEGGEEDDDEFEEDENGNDSNDEESQDEDERRSDKSSLLFTILLLLGVNIFVFSMLLLFFSENGSLTLSWNAKYWFLYSIFAMPLLLFGFKGLNKLD